MPARAPVQDTEKALRNALGRYHDLRRQHEEWARRAWTGLLVREFSNAELQLICDNFTIDDTLTLRALGVLGEGQGFDGRRK